MGQFLKVAPLSQVPPGTIASFDVGGKHVLLANIEGGVYAVSGYCTHEETDLGNGFLIEDRVVCPLHLSQFELKTGAVTNPPATVPLEKFNVKIEDETIFVEV
ncbi:MAG: non-heme iron oxygenase ferredoxin subunit [Thaumarchaeota archaeon]|nr:non-heme iron oxygenase ferredoxin subunit [Nitrososphaerota archaeon]